MKRTTLSPPLPTPPALYIYHRHEAGPTFPPPPPPFPGGTWHAHTVRQALPSLFLRIRTRVKTHARTYVNAPLFLFPQIIADGKWHAHTYVSADNRHASYLLSLIFRLPQRKNSSAAKSDSSRQNGHADSSSLSRNRQVRKKKHTHTHIHTYRERKITK